MMLSPYGEFFWNVLGNALESFSGDTRTVDLFIGNQSLDISFLARDEGYV